MTVLPDSIYVVEVTVGDHVFTMDSEDPAGEAAVNVLDDLRIGWDKSTADPYPQQPNPTTGRVAFFTRDVANLSDIDITTPAQVKVTSAGTVIGGFTGRVSDLEAQSRKTNGADEDLVMFYEVTGVDYVADIGEHDIDLVRPEESAEDRLHAIAALITAAGGPPFAFPPLNPGWNFTEITAYRTNGLAAMLDHLRQLPRIADGQGTGRQLLVPRTTDGVLDDIYLGWQARAEALSWPPLKFEVVDGLLTIVTDDAFTPPGGEVQLLGSGPVDLNGGGLGAITVVGGDDALADGDDATYLDSEFGWSSAETTVALDVLPPGGTYVQGDINLHLRISVDGHGDYPGEAAVFLCNDASGDTASEVAGFAPSAGGWGGGTGFLVPLVDGTIQDLVIPLKLTPWSATVDDVVDALEAGAFLVFNTNHNVDADDPTSVARIYEATVVVSTDVPAVPVGMVIPASEVLIDDVKWTRNKFTSVDQVSLDGPTYDATVTRARTVTRSKA